METNQVVCNGCLSRVPAGAEKCPYCGYSFINTNPAGTLPVNTVLMGRYTLGKCLGLDGEGVSYAAVDAQTARHVIIKEYVPVTICAARTRSGEVLPRPEREVLFKTTRMDFVDMYRTLASLGPVDGLLQVYDLFEGNNTAYAVREPENGTTLLSYLQSRRTPLTVEAALALLVPVFDAVDVMHNRGLLHRGISPETIFIGADGRARLTGFATQGLRTADSELRPQLYEGYAAPEQYAIAEFDGKYTDVYAMGAVVYRAITGTTPPSAGRRRVAETLVPPTSLSGAIPDFVSAAIMRSLRMVAVERIRSMPDLMEALTVPQREAEGFSLTDRQKKYLVIAAIALAFVAAVSLGAILAGGKQQQSAKPSASSTTTSAAASGKPAVSSAASVPPVEETVMVPNFIGKLYTDVQTNTQYINQFMFELSYEFSTEYGAGAVMAQTPASGTKMKQGGTVKLTISNGAETVLIPQVLGKLRDEAKTALKEMGFSDARILVLEYVNDGTYVADTVVKITPEVGTALDPTKDTVTLYVAQTPPAKSESSTTAAPPADANENKDKDKKKD